MAALRSWIGWAALIVSIVAMTVILQSAHVAFSAMEITDTTIHRAIMVPADIENSALTLSVHAEVYVSDQCTRVTHFAMVDQTAIPPVVYPAGQIMSGRGFSRPWVGIYEVRLSVPDAIKSGTYRLAVRSYYTCSWLFFAWTVTAQAAPVTVTVP